MKNVIFFCLILFTCACAKEEAKMKGQYFDIKSLFTNQISNLEKQKAVFVKSVDLNGQKESKDLGDINWQKELAPFVDSDINKPAFAKSYDIIETDSTLRYLLKKGEKLPISSIWMMKKRNEKQISYIEIATCDENMLYNWNKTLIAIFKQGNLVKYSVKGEQKILIFDKERFHIVGQRK